MGPIDWRTDRLCVDAITSERQPDVFRTIAWAVAKKAVQLVLSVGHVLRPEQIGPVPKNAIVVNQARQLELMKKASVCITRTGFNTARIAAHQTGAVTSLEDLTVSHLSTLVAEVLNNSRYCDNARKFQQAIAKTNGLSRAADLLEEDLA